MTRNFAQFDTMDGARVPVILFRREVEGDPATDALFNTFGEWQHNRRLGLWLDHLDDSDIEEVDESTAEELMAVTKARSVIVD